MTITVGSPEELLEAANAAFRYLEKVSEQQSNWVKKTKKFVFGSKKVCIALGEYDKTPAIWLSNPNVMPTTVDEVDSLHKNGEPDIVLMFENEAGLDALIGRLEALRPDVKKS